MRPIEIQSVISDFNNLVDNELRKDTSVLSIIKESLESLHLSRLKRDEKQVIENCLADFKKFILTTPTEHKAYIKQWESISSELFIKYKTTKTGSKSKKYQTNAFGRKILKAMNFTGFRNKYATLISNVISVKACPYCNSMLTVVLSEKKNERARFQLDHYFPQSKYPLLSICFFNLIPCCGHCNQYKGFKTPILGKDFHLYAKETPLKGFKFQIPDENIARFWLSNSVEDIDIQFIRDIDGNNDFVTNHNKRYRITGIYNTQKDIAVELIWKSRAYNKSRIKELQSIADINESEVKRMIISNYIDEKDIHKRPLAKFTQDIAKQLKLI